MSDGTQHYDWEDPYGPSRQVFHAASDPTRFAILNALAEGATHPGRIHKRIDTPIGSLHGPLVVLERAGLVSKERDGNNRVYSLTSRGKQILTIAAVVAAESRPDAGAEQSADPQGREHAHP